MLWRGTEVCMPKMCSNKPGRYSLIESKLGFGTGSYDPFGVMFCIKLCEKEVE